MNIKQESYKDLLIIGGGPSGMAAAIAAKEAGVKKVTLIEKTDSLSGNARYAMNLFDIYDSQAQKANGIEDSKEKFLEDKKRSGEDPERLEIWAREAGRLDEWLRSFGVSLDYNFNQRSHLAKKNLYAGGEITRAMERYVEELGVEVRLETKGGDLIFENDLVKGVKVNYQGTEEVIYTQALILATGGFANNQDLLAEYAPKAVPFITDNKLGASGDYIKPLENLGIQFIKMDKLIVVPAVLSDYHKMLTNSGPGSLFINHKGERFMNESTLGMIAAETVLQQAVTAVWMLVDKHKQEDYPNVRRQIREGRFLEGATLKSLAEQMKVAEEILTKTIQDYNQHAINQTADQFDLIPAKPLSQDGPYYAVRIEPALHMTRGGIQTNADGRVILTDGSIIQNLFASGDVTWQSGALSQSLIWGRLVGQNVAQILH